MWCLFAVLIRCTDSLLISISLAHALFLLVTKVYDGFLRAEACLQAWSLLGSFWSLENMLCVCSKLEGSSA